MKQKIQPTILVNYIFWILASAFMPSNWMRTISHVWCNLKLIAGVVVVFSECGLRDRMCVRMCVGS
mgnify:CR=1 FL=1